MKSNKRKRNQKDYPYPLPQRTVLFSRKKNMQPIPVVGNKYHCFDDGKITFSRHYIVEVSEVLGHVAFKKKYPDLFNEYRENVKQCYWLYANHTDKFVVCEKGENKTLGVYVRTKQGGWFGIGNLFNSGELDATGGIWNSLVKRMDDFDYSEEEKEQIIRENTIE